MDNPPANPYAGLQSCLLFLCSVYRYNRVLVSVIRLVQVLNYQAYILLFVTGDNYLIGGYIAQAYLDRANSTLLHIFAVSVVGNV